MFVTRRSAAPMFTRNGLTSTVLVEKGIVATKLTVTWVEVDVGGCQVRHAHEPEQAYVIISGRGRMHVGDDTADLGRGDLALVPSGIQHGIDNIGDDLLTYVSASTPAFSITDLYERGALVPRELVEKGLSDGRPASAPNRRRC